MVMIMLATIVELKQLKNISKLDERKASMKECHQKSKQKFPQDRQLEVLALTIAKLLST
jgi:hypothetical protein